MYIDFIPLDIYTSLYYFSLLLFVVVIIVGLSTGKWRNFLIYDILAFSLILYIGLRPISYKYFVDMGSYASYFDVYKDGGTPLKDRDLAFHLLIQITSKFFSVYNFFLICAVIYIIPLYYFSKRYFNAQWWVGFIFIISSFSFWSYGTNGIRNGIATSIFILALSQSKLRYQLGLIALSVGFHGSMILPAVAFIVVKFWKNTKILVWFWIISVPLSIIGGSFWESFFAGLGFNDDRISYLTQGNVNKDDFSSTGFRWDFLLYSSSPVLFGWYYIIRMKLNDNLYRIIYSTYIFVNAFWILVIRANFSNRFAYLSWFLMPLIFCYPLLKGKANKYNIWRISVVLIIYFSFTFVMNVILSKS